VVDIRAVVDDEGSKLRPKLIELARQPDVEALVARIQARKART